MSKLDLIKAKSIYQKYYCSFFFIYREEGSDCAEYIRTQVPQEVRRKWAMELMKKNIQAFECSSGVSSDYHSIICILGNHHDDELLRIFADCLRKIKPDPVTRFMICDDILGMRNLKTRIGLLDFAQDNKNLEIFDFFLAYVHDYINNPLEVAENNRARFEDMKEVVAEYDKIRARWRN